MARAARSAPLTLRHEPLPGAAREIAGHLHPVGKVVMRGRAVRRRCFVTDGARCVLPAFGAYAGGLNVCDARLQAALPEGFTAHLIGDGRIFAIGRGDALPGLTRVAGARGAQSRRKITLAIQPKSSGEPAATRRRRGPTSRAPLADLLLEAGLDELEVGLGARQDHAVRRTG